MHWRNERDDYRMNDLGKGMLWYGMRTSGKRSNPAKRFFLKLATTSVRAVCAQRDTDGVSYHRKAMIRCEMVSNWNGQWEKRQLLPELQGLIRKYGAIFEVQVIGHFPRVR